MLYRKVRRCLISSGMLFSIFGLTAGLCGCSGKISDQTNQGGDQEPVTFTFYNADGQEDPWADPVARKITEATGVTLRRNILPAGRRMI